MDICQDADEQLQNDVSVSADFAVSCISGTAQSGKSSKESKDEEMAPDASVGKKRKKQIDDATQREKSVEESMEAEDRGVKHAQWMSMFGIGVLPERVRRPEPDLLLEAAEKVAEKCLRDHVTMPADPDNTEVSLQDAESGGWLPPASCAFRRCTWCVAAKASSKSAYEEDPEHPWDQELREHVASAHSPAIQGFVRDIVGPERAKQCEWDIYKEACSAQERKSIPVTGPSVDRRTCERTVHVYNDERVRALVCFACARVKVDTGRIRSAIAFRTGKWLFSLPPGSLVKNFSMAEFTRRYRKSGTPLADPGSRTGDVVGPDFTDWQLKLHVQYMQLLTKSMDHTKEISWKDLQQLSHTSLLCCPEDHICENGCKEHGYLCPSCKVPVCRECWMELTANKIIPQALINDNFQGFIQPWIYEMGVTWMEKTVSSPYWTGITLFSIGQRGADRKTRRRHLMHDAMYGSVRRVAFKGQVFSAPMDWPDLLEQLEKIEKDEARIELPVLGEALLSRVRLSITSGLVDLNKHMKQATVRRDVVVQLIRMHRDAGHPDYAKIFMSRVEKRALELAPTNEPTIPTGLLDVLDEDSDERLDDNVDKAATPAPRMYNAEDLQLEMERTRPQILLNQRDSDTQKNVEASRSNAFSTISQLQLKTGSNLIDQFHASYIPRVFNMSLPWCVGGPDFPRQKRWRRCFEDSPEVSLDMYTEMMSNRVEANIRWDWDLNPALWSLSFASKVNLGVSMSIKRCLRRSDEAEQAGDTKIGEYPDLSPDYLNTAQYQNPYYLRIGTANLLHGEALSQH